MKILSPRVHGYLDFVVIALFLLAPTLFGFHGLPASICYALAAIHTTMTLLTAFPFGIAKVIPFTIHGGAEAGVAVALLAAPWLFGFSDVHAARNFFLLSGVLIGAVFAVTDYKAADIAYGKPGVRSFRTTGPSYS